MRNVWTSNNFAGETSRFHASLTSAPCGPHQKMCKLASYCSTSQGF